MTPQQIEALKLALEALEIEEAQTHYPSQFLLRAITAIKEALADHAMQKVQRLGQEIEQEPVAWWDAKLGAFDEKHFDQLQPLYTAPPQRKPLTDEEIDAIADEYLVDYRIPAGCALNFARDIEAAHSIKEKNQ